MHCKLDWKTIVLTTLENAKARVGVLLKRYEEVFSGSRGALKHFSAKLTVNSSDLLEVKVCSIHHKRSHRSKIKRLEAEGIIEKVPHSKWAAPIVSVP